MLDALDRPSVLGLCGQVSRYTPLPPRFCKILILFELRVRTLHFPRKILRNKDLKCKIFQNKELAAVLVPSALAVGRFGL
jgi:hypothetical protein